MKLTKAQIAEIKETPRVLGAMTELAERYGVAPSTVRYHWMRMHKPQRKTVAASRILSKEQISRTSADGELPGPDRSTPLSDPKLSVVDDPRASIVVLQSIRDDSGLPADVRTRASVALLTHGKEKESSAWVPPTDEAGWISTLVDLILDQPQAVRAGVLSGVSDALGLAPVSHS